MSLRKVNAHSPQIHNLRPLKRHPALINILPEYDGSCRQSALYATHTLAATLQQDANAKPLSWSPGENAAEEARLNSSKRSSMTLILVCFKLVKNV